MRKFQAIILICAMILTVSGCSKKPKIENKNESSDITSTEPSSQVSEESSKEMSSGTLPISSIPVSSEDVPAVATVINAEEYDGSNLDGIDNTGIGWGQGVRMADLNRPETCDPAQEKYEENGGLFIMPAEPKKMYLTFDQGYENGYTPQILDALKAENVPAVFFVTGDYAKRNPELVQRMIDDGHVIGNHGAKHKNMPKLTTEDAVEEIVTLHNYVVENFNYQMTLFRPPEGSFSACSMQIAKDLGYKTVMWSFAYKDYDVTAQMGVEKAYPKVSQAAHPGAIYLLHAVSKDNTEMLPDLIKDFKEQGFELANLQTDVNDLVPNPEVDAEIDTHIDDIISE